MRHSHSRPPKRPRPEDREPDRKPAVAWFLYALMVVAMGIACYQICIRPFESVDQREQQRLEEDARWMERLKEHLYASQEKEAG